MKEVGKRLKALRESIGISQVKMAEAIGSTQSSVNRYENGQSSPSVELLRRYADYFDVSLDYIFARTDKPQGKIYEFRPKASPAREESAQGAGSASPRTSRPGRSIRKRTSSWNPAMPSRQAAGLRTCRPIHGLPCSPRGTGANTSCPSWAWAAT